MRRPPPLEDLHILAYIELSGSQAKAAAALAMHQSTVCRSLQHLRLVYRAHQLLQGQLRIGTDLLHQSLLLLLPWGQQVPHRFRGAAHWAELIRHGLQDAAIISSLALDKPLLSGKAPQWKGLTAMPLGQLSMQLIASTDCIRRALLPRKLAMPLLHQGVMSAGSLIEQQPAACQERAAGSSAPTTASWQSRSVCRC